MIETTMIRRTLARDPSSCRFRVAAVKKSVAACCSGEAPLLASIRDSTPLNASARRFPVTTSTPAEREIGTTSCPCSSSTSTTWQPTRPVAPATAILPSAFTGLSFAGRRAPFACRSQSIVPVPTGRSRRGHPQIRTEVFRPPLVGLRVGERSRELRARVDRELAIDARQVYFDCSLGDEERLRDFAVRRPFGRHFRHAPLTGGERVDAAEGDTPWTRACGEQLTLGPVCEGRGTADRRQLDRMPEVLARLGAAVVCCGPRPAPRARPCLVPPLRPLAAC